MELWSGVRIAFPQAVVIFLKLSEASSELLIVFFIFLTRRLLTRGSVALRKVLHDSPYDRFIACTEHDRTHATDTFRRLRRIGEQESASRIGDCTHSQPQIIIALIPLAVPSGAIPTPILQHSSIPSEGANSAIGSVRLKRPSRQHGRDLSEIGPYFLSTYLSPRGMSPAPLTSPATRTTPSTSAPFQMDPGRLSRYQKMVAVCRTSSSP